MYDKIHYKKKKKQPKEKSFLNGKSTEGLTESEMQL